jgi:hypothetical protein
VPGQPGQQCLALRAARVRDHQRHVGGRVGSQRREFLGDLLACVLRVADDHDRGGVEQRGGGDRGQLPRGQPARGHLARPGRAVASRGGQARHGPFHEQFLVPGDHADPGTAGSGRCGALGFTHGHVTSLPWSGRSRAT